MTQIRGYELKEAHMALERGGVVIDKDELKRLLTFQEIAGEYEKRIARLERALKKAQKMVKIAEEK